MTSQKLVAKKQGKQAKKARARTHTYNWLMGTDKIQAKYFSIATHGDLNRLIIIIIENGFKYCRFCRDALYHALPH